MITYSYKPQMTPEEQIGKAILKMDYLNIIEWYSSKRNLIVKFLVASNH